MRYFIAGGGCYGSYYVRQLDRARALGKIQVSEIVVVDKDPRCALAGSLKDVAGARLEVCDWIDFGAQAWKNRDAWKQDMWVPTPIGPHILSHWVTKQWNEEFSGKPLKPVGYTGPVLPIPYAKITPDGTFVLSHAPGLCPVNCVEPELCPLTKDIRDWEMKDTVRDLVANHRAAHGIEAVGVFVCQHHSHGVGTIPMSMIYQEWNQLRDQLLHETRRVAVATVSACHGILDVFELSDISN